MTPTIEVDPLEESSEATSAESLIEAAPGTPVETPTETPVIEPILFSPTRRPTPPPAPAVDRTPIDPAIIMEIMNFKQVARTMEIRDAQNRIVQPNIAGVQFQCRAETDEDEISHYGHVIYDTRYLDQADGRIFLEMQNPERWNRIAAARIRMHRLTTEAGPMDGMYFWNVGTDRLIRLHDAGPETEGAVLDSMEDTYVVGG